MENETTVMQETPAESASADAFLSGFYGEQKSIAETDVSDAKTETAQAKNDETQESNADQKSEAKASDGESEDAPAEEKTAQGEEAEAAAPKKWTLKHLKDKKEVEEAELVSLAEMGLDYGFVRGKYEEAKPIMEIFSVAAKNAGMTVSEYVSHVRTAMKQSAGMSEDEAKRSVDLEDREALLSAKEQEEKAQTEREQAETARKEAESKRVQDDIARFIKIYPDVKPEEIPQEVWKAVNAGEQSLVEAWQSHLIQKFKTENAAKEQKTANAARSTGSMRTSGKDKSATDPFLMGFNG